MMSIAVAFIAALQSDPVLDGATFKLHGFMSIVLFV
jgi:hypothetical protein